MKFVICATPLHGLFSPKAYFFFQQKNRTIRGFIVYIHSVNSKPIMYETEFSRFQFCQSLKDKIVDKLSKPFLREKKGIFSALIISGEWSIKTSPPPYGCSKIPY